MTLHAEKLKQTALDAQTKAYAPYSGFSVGAAILAGDAIFAGCNVENAAYPLGQCAEATAIGNMVTAGHQQITAIMIASPNDEFCYPCGGCRQKIAEFASDNTPVILINQRGETTKTTIGALLPNAFRVK